MNDAASLPSKPRTRLAPLRRDDARKLRTPMIVAIAIALVLHLLAVIAVTARFPGLLSPAHPPPPPQETQVEMVQDNASLTSDAKLGRGQHTPQSATPPPTPPPTPTPPTQGGPDLPTDPHGETPPPGPPAPEVKAPTPPVEPPRAQPQPTPPTPPTPPAPQHADEDSKSPPEIRLGNEDEGEQSTGGTADHPSAPDPNMPNLKPAYPTDAARRHESGAVQMMVHVGPDGKAMEVVVANSSGSSSLDKAATGAVKLWRFRPAVQNGHATDSYAPVELNFVLTHN